MKELISKYKAELLIALGAISSILATLATKEGVDAAIMSVLIAVFAVIIELVKNGVSKEAVNLFTNFIVILLEELGNIEIKDNEVVAVASNEKEKSITIDEIKRRLLEK